MLKTKDLQDGRTNRGAYEKNCKIKFEFLYRGCQLSLLKLHIHFYLKTALEHWRNNASQGTYLRKILSYLAKQLIFFQQYRLFSCIIFSGVEKFLKQCCTFWRPRTAEMSKLESKVVKHIIFTPAVV